MNRRSGVGRHRGTTYLARDDAARAHAKVRDAPVSKPAHTPASAATGIEQAIRKLDGRWKLVILFHLFGGKTLRFSDLERAIPGISQKMLSQQLRQLEGDGIVTRIVHAQVPPKVEYHLTEWGQSLCPALDRLLTWAEQQPSPNDADRPRLGRS